MERDELAAAGTAGDSEALMARIAMDRRTMYGIAYAYLRSEADALEAIQETVCRVWVKRKSLRDPRLFSTWMIRILVRVCLDTKRKKNREVPLLNAQEEKGLLLQSLQGREHGSLMQGRTAERLDMAQLVQTLPSEQRMVVTLKYYRDMTVTDIAELMEKPEGTVKTWLHKALKQLRRDMAPDNKGKEAARLGTE